MIHGKAGPIHGNARQALTAQRQALTAQRQALPSQAPIGAMLTSTSSMQALESSLQPLGLQPGWALSLFGESIAGARQKPSSAKKARIRLNAFARILAGLRKSHMVLGARSRVDLARVGQVMPIMSGCLRSTGGQS